MRSSRIYALLFMLSAPLFALAAPPTDFKGLVKDTLFPIMSSLVGLLMSVALAVFFIGMIRFIASSAGAQDKVKGKDLMLWGIIALFVMVSVWGIVNILKTTFLGA